MLFSTTYSLSCERESTQNGGQQQKRLSTFLMCPKYSGSLKLPQLPESFNCQDFSRVLKMFGHKWKLSSTFVNCLKLSGIMKILKSPNFSDRIFFNFNLFHIPGHIKISKTARNVFKHPWKAFSRIFASIRIFQVPNFFE